MTGLAQHPCDRTSSQYTLFSQRITPLLETVYGDQIADKLVHELYDIVCNSIASDISENLNKWSQDNILLITYGDSIVSSTGEKPLTTLKRFLGEHLSGVITGVHILPFTPFTSDDGFAVKDYLSVNPALGGWDEISAIAKDFDLMVDLVVNHVSSQHEWFQQFKQGQEPGCNYFITADLDTDVSSVVRPRSTPLLVEVDTVKGKQYVWATFSPDQVDVNFANPAVLIEFLKIILFYVQAGAKYVRLDAIGYLWKQLGTPCIHLPQTHALIRLIREVLQMVNPAIAIITETNVPNRENLSYFGNRNEAHMIYNFSLPPLVLNALMQGRSDHLKTWMMSMPPAPVGCAYLNFTASHDGIGLRPAEGLLTDKEYTDLVDTMKRFGGRISMRRRSDGSESPYEINISLFDAMKGTVKGEDQWQIQRFLCSQTIMLALEGIPSFYIHSLLGTRNDNAKVERTAHNRAINRHQWSYEELEAQLSSPTSSHAQVLSELCRLIQIRRRQPAFHPNATQYTLHPLNKSLFAFWRQSMMRDQSIFSIHNLSDKEQTLRLTDLNLIITDPWCDLISGTVVDDIHAKFVLKPYQSAWITNKFESSDVHS
jgi:sucrose phosphorylase